MQRDDKGGSPSDPKYRLLVEGSNLLHVLGTPGVNPRRTTTNHVAEAAKVRIVCQPC